MMLTGSAQLTRTSATCPKLLIGTRGQVRSSQSVEYCGRVFSRDQLPDDERVSWSDGILELSKQEKVKPQALTCRMLCMSVKFVHRVSPGKSFARPGTPIRKQRRSMAPPLAAMPDVRTPRVLSIQSHTVQGYVGNKAAVFPLQLLGFEVDPINSVQFSNHTGYSIVRGQVLDGDQLWALIEGLEANDLLYYTHLLTGYIGSLSFLEMVLQVLQKLRAVNPNLIYVCDPVMGDEGKFYIKPELAPVFRSKVVPVASMLTPNQFELEILTGSSIRTEKEALQACETLHALGPSQVIITSLDIDNKLLLIGSDKPNKDEPAKQFRISMPKIPAYFTGTGDLMTALLLGWSYKYQNDLAKAAELAVSSLQGVLRRTISDYEEAGVSPNLKQLELRLVQSQTEISSPKLAYRAEKL
ncbi:hypothetical protein Mp_1g06330 [Marchantia polymorpha subsp. ruderalis]|uniref:pyridoxal kinase n=4 Tax=Marchantia polymorpha TaxID=3197 RepID=A0AAF6AM45_MARPO|nr:hypothetical protein MARPO_0043s0025 [Marchantia polymorpha]BBM97515.1 hypothetical protein Mp_1g06330 [Marchantia polymorpha subsp. ruderalis]|eukprot:PTQ39758.1 hypothetical protein MARPO_0043s0025 [Marchantia polymorpha]